MRTILHVLRMQHSRHFFTTVFCRQSICPVIPSRMFLDRCSSWRTYLCIYEFCAVLHHSLTHSLPPSLTHTLTHSRFNTHEYTTNRHEDGVDVRLTGTAVTDLEIANSNVTSLTIEDGSSPILSQLDQLLNIHAANNSITVLPRGILPDENLGLAGWNPNIVSIDMSNNLIEVVDTRFFELVDSVRSVNLESNQLRVAPTIMGAFASDGPTRWCEVGDAFRYHLPNIAPDSTCCTWCSRMFFSDMNSIISLTKTHTLLSEVLEKQVSI